MTPESKECIFGDETIRLMILRIYFSSAWTDSSSQCPWALCDESGIVLQSGASRLDELPKASESIAILSSSSVLCVTAKMPAKSRRRWESALPYIVEDHTLTDPEENHVVPGAVQSDGQRSLFVVDKPWLQAIVSACDVAKIKLRKAIPEFLLPRLPPESWVAVWDGKQGFMRTGSSSGICLDRGDAQCPPLALTLSLNKHRENPPVHIYLRLHHTADTHEPPSWPDLPVAITLDEEWDWRRETIPAEAVNLLWGAFATESRVYEWIARLRPAAAILLIALFIETLGANIEWALLTREKNIATQEMERTFRKTFGNGSAIVNPPLQMQRNLSALRHAKGLPDDNDFLPLLDQISNTLASLPSGSITGLHYESGRLDVDLRLRGEVEIRALSQRLQGRGLTAHFGDTHNSGNGVETRLTVLSGTTL